MNNKINISGRGIMSVIGTTSLTFGSHCYCREVDGLGDIEELVGCRSARELGYDGVYLDGEHVVEAIIKELPLRVYEV